MQIEITYKNETDIFTNRGAVNKEDFEDWVHQTEENVLQVYQHGLEVKLRITEDCFYKFFAESSLKRYYKQFPNKFK